MHLALFSGPNYGPMLPTLGAVHVLNSVQCGVTRIGWFYSEGWGDSEDVHVMGGTQ
jgi:hypothetical protein